MNILKITKLSSENVASVVRIHKACVKVTNVKAYSKDAIRTWLKQISAKNVKSQLRNSKWIVLKKNNRNIGFTQYSTEDKTLYQINISPRYSGKGFGKLIYDYIEKDFIKHKVKTIDLNATLNAVPFYKKLGFKRIKNITFKIDTVPIKMVEMKKFLDVKIVFKKN